MVDPLTGTMVASFVGGEAAAIMKDRVYDWCLQKLADHHKQRVRDSVNLLMEEICELNGDPSKTINQLLEGASSETTNAFRTDIEFMLNAIDDAAWPPLAKLGAFYFHNNRRRDRFFLRAGNFLRNSFAEDIEGVKELISIIEFFKRSVSRHDRSWGVGYFLDVKNRFILIGDHQEDPGGKRWFYKIAESSHQSDLVSVARALGEAQLVAIPNPPLFDVSLLNTPEFGILIRVFADEGLMAKVVREQA